MSHTKEPWRVDPERELRVEDQHGRSIASCGCSDLLRDEWEDNARRIVACVNACAGISTEELERPGLLVNLPSDHNIIAQRDELLAALKELCTRIDIDGASPLDSSEYSDAIEVITKAEAADA